MYASIQTIPRSSSCWPLRTVPRFQPNSRSARRWPPSPNARTVRAINKRRALPLSTFFRLSQQLFHFLDQFHLSTSQSFLAPVYHLQEIPSLEQFSFRESLINLQELFLGKNHLNVLSDELYQLINLQKLDLSENQLSKLSGELGQLINLLELFLDQNHLSSLPAELGQLTNLRTLFLNKNEFSSLPAELGKLVNLQWLDLEENQLSGLPAELGQLAHLHTLHLSQNPQLQIPPPEVV